MTNQTKKILIYAENPDSPAYKALEKVVRILFDAEPFKDRIRMSAELEKELATGEYGLVIDALGIESFKLHTIERRNERISRDSEITGKYNIPLRFASNPINLVGDITAISASHFGQGEE